jgi:imidazolonepropionase-like amidohydrolase
VKIPLNNSSFAAYIVDMRLPFLSFLFVACVFLLGTPALASDLALVGATIYSSPTDSPIVNGSILVRDGHVLAVGPASTIHVPHDATVIDCKGLVVTAGFWNSHVHILLPGLLHAENVSSADLASQLQEMLTRWGFTTVFDIASVLQNTNLIRHRIESGEVPGPRILTVGEPFWIKGGTPVYVRPFLEAHHLSMPEIESAAQAVERVRRQIHDGADGIKIFANSIEQDGILTMPLDLAKPITEEAHRAGKPVFAHVSNNAGVEVALQSGVDILAHTVVDDELWSPSFAARLTAAHMALTPTLTLFDVESRKANASADFIEKVMTRAAQQLKTFSQAGGQVLFGTDVGYIDTFDTSEEFTWMARAGMTFPQILASLTTNPAQRFGYSSRSGRIAKGMDADLVVLSADPAQSITALAQVRYTISAGKIIYSRKEEK